MSKFIYDESKRKIPYWKHRAAHHEAGHAVMGRVLDLDCGQATVETAIADETGHAVIRGSEESDAQIVAIMAGRAEREFGFEHDQGSDASDRSEIGFMCLKANRTINIDRLRRKTRRLVRQHRARIERVAVALLERGTLLAEEIDALM